MEKGRYSSTQATAVTNHYYGVTDSNLGRCAGSKFTCSVKDRAEKPNQRLRVRDHNPGCNRMPSVRLMLRHVEGPSNCFRPGVYVGSGRPQSVDTGPTATTFTLPPSNMAKWSARFAIHRKICRTTKVPAKNPMLQPLDARWAVAAVTPSRRGRPRRPSGPGAFIGSFVQSG
jgi:hypothetical protein